MWVVPSGPARPISDGPGEADPCFSPSWHAAQHHHPHQIPRRGHDQAIILDPLVADEPRPAQPARVLAPPDHRLDQPAKLLTYFILLGRCPTTHSLACTMSFAVADDRPPLASAACGVIPRASNSHRNSPAPYPAPAATPDPTSP